MGKGPVWPSASLQRCPHPQQPHKDASAGTVSIFQMWRLRACYLTAQLLDLGRGGAGGRRQRKRPLLLGEQPGLLACAVSRNELGRSFWTKCWPCHVQQDDLQGLKHVHPATLLAQHAGPQLSSPLGPAAPLGFGQCGLERAAPGSLVKGTHSPIF